MERFGKGPGRERERDMTGQTGIACKTYPLPAKCISKVTLPTLAAPPRLYHYVIFTSSPNSPSPPVKLKHDAQSRRTVINTKAHPKQNKHPKRKVQEITGELTK